MLSWLASTKHRVLRYGKFWGTIGNGFIFKADSNGENYTVVHDFGENGSYPSFGNLCYVNGILDGTILLGGMNEMGVFVLYNIATEA